MRKATYLSSKRAVKDKITRHKYSQIRQNVFFFLKNEVFIFINGQ